MLSLVPGLPSNPLDDGVCKNVLKWAERSRQRVIIKKLSPNANGKDIRIAVPSAYFITFFSRGAAFNSYKLVLTKNVRKYLFLKVRMTNTEKEIISILQGQTPRIVQ